jgi:hypothetical protein
MSIRKQVFFGFFSRIWPVFEALAAVFHPVIGWPAPSLVSLFGIPSHLMDTGGCMRFQHKVIWPRGVNFHAGKENKG